MAAGLYTPLAALLGLDVMRRHAPSAAPLVGGLLEHAPQTQIPLRTPPRRRDAAARGPAAPQADDDLQRRGQRALDWAHDTAERGIDWLVREGQRLGRDARLQGLEECGSQGKGITK